MYSLNRIRTMPKSWIQPDDRPHVQYPTYRSTSRQYWIASLPANASWLWGSMYRRKYQDDPVETRHRIGFSGIAICNLPNHGVLASGAFPGYRFYIIQIQQYQRQIFFFHSVSNSILVINNRGGFTPISLATTVSIAHFKIDLFYQYLLFQPIEFLPMASRTSIPFKKIQRESWSFYQVLSSMVK